MIELLFLLGFSLHNLEEALWLPGWSKHAEKYHKKVSENEFRFAVIMVTAIGYLITFQHLVFSSSKMSEYIYLGFIMMMVVNVIFPHVISTIVLKKYAPGTLTGVMLNAPIGIYILNKCIGSIDELLYVIISCIIISAILLPLIKLFFRLGRDLFD